MTLVLVVGIINTICCYMYLLVLDLRYKYMNEKSGSKFKIFNLVVYCVRRLFGP